MKLATVFAVSLLLCSVCWGKTDKLGTSIAAVGVDLTNTQYGGSLPPSAEFADISSHLEKWAKQRQADGTLPAIENYILTNKEAFIAEAPSGASTWSALHSGFGLQPTQDTFQGWINQTTSDSRKALVEEIEAKGLYAVLSDQAKSFKVIAKDTAIGIGPNDNGDCQSYAQEGNRLMALGALFAIVDPWVGAVIAAGGAAEYLYGDVYCPSGN
jgi:hypothetical protein